MLYFQLIQKMQNRHIAKAFHVKTMVRIDGEANSLDPRPFFQASCHTSLSSAERSSQLHHRPHGSQWEEADTTLNARLHSSCTVSCFMNFLYIFTDPLLKAQQSKGCVLVNQEALVCHLCFFVHQADTPTDSVAEITCSSFRSIILKVCFKTQSEYNHHK